MLPGFELLFSSVQSQLRSSKDAVVCAIHWIIITSGFKLTGVGENPTGAKQHTESLLSGWNDAEIYVFHYETCHEPKQNYLLKILPVDSSLLLHFQKENDENVTTLELSVQEFASEDLSLVATAFRNTDRLKSLVHQSLIVPAMGSLFGTRSHSQEDNNTRATSSRDNPSREKKKDKKSPLLVEERKPQYQPRPMQPAWHDEDGGIGINPFSVGRSDLDPLAGLEGPGMGGGMIMDPRYSGGPRFGTEPRGGRYPGVGRGVGIQPGGLPPGAVPPGARFDPFGPPGTRPGPDPDHERPPGYDDMYM